MVMDAELLQGEDLYALQYLSDELVPQDWPSLHLSLLNRYLSVATEMHTPLEVLQLESALAHAASDVFFDEDAWMANYRAQFLRLYYLCMLHGVSTYIEAGIGRQDLQCELWSEAAGILATLVMEFRETQQEFWLVAHNFNPVLTAAPAA